MILLMGVGILFGPAHSQKFCQQMRVHFALGDSAVSPLAAQQIEDLFARNPAESYYIELSGHTDQLDDPEFNLRLSEARVREVEAYIGKRFKVDEFRSFHYGESRPLVMAGEDDSLAVNRRVEVSLIPVEDGRLTFGQDGISIGVKPEFFGDCSICGSNLRMTTAKNSSEAENMGTPLLTDNGDRLFTMGMARLDYECDSKPDGEFDAVIRTAGECYDDFGVWKFDEALGRWVSSDDSLSCDGEGNYTMRVTGFRPSLGCNMDIRIPPILASCETTLEPEGRFRLLANASFLEEGFEEQYGRERAVLERSECQPEVRSLALQGGQYFYYAGMRETLVDSVAKDTVSVGNRGGEEMIVEIITKRFGSLERTKYDAVPRSDTTLLVKVPRGCRNVGYYLPYLEYSLKMRRKSNRKYRAEYLNLPFEIGLSVAREARSFEVDGLKKRYRRWGKVYKVKVRKRDLRQMNHY